MNNNYEHFFFIEIFVTNEAVLSLTIRKAQNGLIVYVKLIGYVTLKTALLVT